VKTPLEPPCLQVQVLPDAAHKQVDASAIKVETLNGTVMLSGFARNPEEQQAAERLAANVKGVKSVRNGIVVRP